jgi:hypothetical protein
MLHPADSLIGEVAASQPGVPGVSPSAILEISIPGVSLREGYLVCSPWIEEEPSKDLANKGGLAASNPAQTYSASVVHPLSIDVSKRNVKVRALQRWTGRVERVLDDRFVAIVSDVTTPANPTAEVELDVQDVSPADRPLITEGAIFYWAIVYRDTKAGQRERIASIRFARQPKLSREDVEDIFNEADEMVAFLESS